MCLCTFYSHVEYISNGSYACFAGRVTPISDMLCVAEVRQVRCRTAINGYCAEHTQLSTPVTPV